MPTPRPPADFWTAFDQLIATCDTVIDRPKDSKHPRYPTFTYPLDYGYLAGTASADGEGIDIWRGSDTAQRFDAVFCTVDLFKRDSEVKLLIGCTEDEKQIIMQFYNDNEFMKGVLVRREE